MRHHLRIVVITSALAATVVTGVPSVEAGGSFGIHIGTGGFGVSVGVGDWGPYTNSWTNPHWSLDFNAALTGYGEWVWAGNLGRVWRPWVAVGWRPYTYGRWVRTTLGWTWVAYEPWGYIPHHYGSWAMCDYGWVWVPGYSYSSANVVWVRSGGYVGWYARPPWGWSHAARGYRHGYRDGYRDGWHDARYATYVDWHHLGSDNVSHYAVRHSVATRNRVQDHAAPPTVAEVRRRGGVSVTETRISQRTVTMNGRRITVARPEGVARSIENHASGTAAEALAPRALERRQPSVRSSASSTPRPSSARSPASDGSSDLPRLNGGRLRAPDQPQQRGSVHTGDRRDDAQTGRATGPTDSRLFRSPGATRSSGATGAGPSPGSSRSGRDPSSSVSTSSRRAPLSKPATRGVGSAPPARTVDQSPSRLDSGSNRSMNRAGSSRRGTMPTRRGAPPAARSSAARERSAQETGADVGVSSGSSGGRLQRTSRRSEGTSESDKKPAQRPKPGRKR